MAGAKGLLVALEGIDAVGKRTHSGLLGSWLRSHGVRTGTMSFPDYNTAIGREIKGYLQDSRDYPLEVGHMLYAVNRWEKKTEIESLLAQSDVLIVNRYYPSNFAYGIANGLKLEWLANLEEGLPKAQLVLVLDAPASELFSRRRRAKDRNERDVAFQEKVRRAYRDLSKQLGWEVIDATVGIPKTSEAVVSAVSRALEARRSAS
jgi:dTMP kinase